MTYLSHSAVIADCINEYKTDWTLKIKREKRNGEKSTDSESEKEA